MLQETLGLDEFVDRCIKTKVDDAMILACAKLVFSNGCNIDDDYIVQRRSKIENYQVQLQKLIKIPTIVQRSKEWFDIRKTLITASDFAQALGDGKFGSQRQIYQKKCGYEPEQKLSASTCAPLKWGVMFEPIAQEIYTSRTNLKVHEFGLLRHPDPKRKYFGASPDGINEFGIMLEIKCPFKRKINGEIPTQYFYQIQGQLDVCGLCECDYLECEFKEDDFENYDKDYKNEHGIFLEYGDGDEYVYCPLKQNVHDWLADMQKRPGFVIHYWKLVKYNVIRVYKDEAFIQTKLDALQEVWDRIEMYQDNKDVYDKEVKTSGRFAKTNEPVKITGYSFI